MLLSSTYHLPLVGKAIFEHCNGYNPEALVFTLQLPKLKVVVELLPP